MENENDKEILKRLHAISDKEWVEVIDKLTTYVHFKLKGKTLFGAHTEQNLGVNPMDYYVDEAIAKLFSLEWKWQFEKYSLIDQLKRIVGSMLSTNIEKYKAKKEHVYPTDDETLNALVEKENIEDNDKTHKLFQEALEVCSKDDEELQLYVFALNECDSFEEMSYSLGWEKKKLYSLQKKMTRRITKYFETKNE